MKIKKIKNWWNSLEWDSDKGITLEEREKPLTTKKLFLRDKIAVITTIIEVLIIIIILMFSISNANGYDYYQNVTINSSQVPINGTFQYLFNPISNGTLLFTLNQSNEYLDLNFINSHTFINDSQYTFNIDWLVDNTLWASNETLNSSIIVSNNQNNNSISIGLNFNLNYQGDSVIGYNSTNMLDIINGTYFKQISVLDLPDNGILDFIITGLPNSNFTISNCIEPLICPTGLFYFDSEGRKLVQMSYNIPITTAISQYNSTFTVFADNKNSTVKVLFDIGVPNLFAKPLELPEKCEGEIKNMPYATQFECERLITEYQAKKVVELQNYFSKVNTDKICKDYIKTEFVVGDSISEEIMTTNKLLRDENTHLREKLGTKDNLILTLNEDKSNLLLKINESFIDKKNEVSKVTQECVDRTAMINQKAIEYEQNVFKGKSFYIKLVAFLFALIPGLIALIQYIFETMTRKSFNLKYVYLLGASGGFAVLWLFTLFFL